VVPIDFILFGLIALLVIVFVLSSFLDNIAAAIGVNVVVNLRYAELADAFPFIGVTVWIGRVPVFYVGGFLVMMALVGWHPHAPHKVL
jgi:hypothetical protein